MTPNISIRESIRWPPHAASEPTSTVVLTSGKRYYVDVRVTHPTNTDPRNSTVGEDLLPVSRIDWAFAGTSSSEIRQTPDNNKVIHSQWKHWIDSKTMDGESVADEGDMFPDEGGELALEKGRMVNPATGLMADYEELWKELAPQLVQLTEGEIENGPLTSNALTNDRQHACVVLLLEDDESQTRGMVIRVGNFCQGILRTGPHITVERWEWKKDAGWRRNMRAGDFWLPCGVVMADANSGRLVEGGEVTDKENVWKCIEFSWF
ncbi:Hypothetical protein R9X50_00266300 [Acrodontium crateriforme]|uniref:Protein HRI1 n=1 Tax=Acrodontium crateriforme TaxID=150365 RepID=A0AAQ3M1N6_9PEZI|nr:Hypothetical protein R9X50_00266300 [Acrodontium crateriforme]